MYAGRLRVGRGTLTFLRPEALDDPARASLSGTTPAPVHPIDGLVKKFLESFQYHYTLSEEEPKVHITTVKTFRQPASSAMSVEAALDLE